MYKFSIAPNLNLYWLTVIGHGLWTWEPARMKWESWSVDWITDDYGNLVPAACLPLQGE